MRWGREKGVVGSGGRRGDEEVGRWKEPDSPLEPQEQVQEREASHMGLESVGGQACARGAVFGVGGCGALWGAEGRVVRAVAGFGGGGV